MSQPFNSDYRLPALREIDQERGEFWVSSPWLFPSSGENLSAYERNGIHLNAGNGDFIDMSFLTGADSTGDGRTVVACDITDDGMPELLVRQVGGGPLLVFENQFPRTSWIRISLEGMTSNRMGIGAKITCETENQKIYRELYPVINFLSQAPASVQLGLGKAKEVKRLKIVWPSGTEQELTDLPINCHIRIRESGKDPAYSRIPH